MASYPRIIRIKAMRKGKVMNYCHPWEWKVWNAAHTSLWGIFPTIPPCSAHRASIRPSDKLLFRPIRNLVSVEIKLFNGKDGYELFFEKWHPRSFHPTLLFPFELDERWGGRMGDLHRGRCHGKTRNITGFCRMWSWIILSRVKYLQTGLQDVGCKTLMPLGISPPVHSQLN